MPPANVMKRYFNSVNRGKPTVKQIRLMLENSKKMERNAEKEAKNQAITAIKERTAEKVDSKECKNCGKSTIYYLEKNGIILCLNCSLLAFPE